MLSKALRFVDHDLAQLRDVATAVGLDCEVLVTRYRDEMSHVIGDPKTHRERFLSLIEELFGEMKRVAAERVLARPVDDEP